MRASVRVFLTCSCCVRIYPKYGVKFNSRNMSVFATVYSTLFLVILTFQTLAVSLRTTKFNIQKF